MTKIDTGYFYTKTEGQICWISALGANYRLLKERCIKTIKDAADLKSSLCHQPFFGKPLNSLREIAN